MKSINEFAFDYLKEAKPEDSDTLIFTKGAKCILENASIKFDFDCTEVVLTNCKGDTLTLPFNSKTEGLVDFFSTHNKEVNKLIFSIACQPGTYVFGSITMPDKEVGLSVGSRYLVKYRGKDEIGIINDLGEECEYSPDFFSTEP